ncbi:MAG: AraC family transcriptional regulator [Thermodesulfobacteriota bacterium]
MASQLGDAQQASPLGGRSRESARMWMPGRLPGVFLLAADYRRQDFAPHIHEEYALGVIERGAMAFRYRGEGLVAPAGCVNLVVPGEAHDGRGADAAGWSYRMFYLEPSLLARAASELAGRRAAAPHFAAGVLRDPGLAARVRGLHRLLEQDEAPRLALEARLLDLLTHWIARHAVRPPAARRAGREPGAVARARDILDARCAEDLSLAYLAAETGLSPWRLARAFAAAVGLPPHAYLVQARVRRARERLAGPQPLADLAADLGFADQSHFTRAFKRVVGVSPGAWRKIVQDR